MGGGHLDPKPSVTSQLKKVHCELIAKHTRMAHLFKTTKDIWMRATIATQRWNQDMVACMQDNPKWHERITTGDKFRWALPLGKCNLSRFDRSGFRHWVGAVESRTSAGVESVANTTSDTYKLYTDVLRHSTQHGTYTYMLHVCQTSKLHWQLLHSITQANLYSTITCIEPEICS